MPNATLTSASAEPHQNWRARPVIAAFLATRPAFLTITLVGVLQGFALAYFSWANSSYAAASALMPAQLLVGGGGTLLVALFAHAAANVVNDLFDTDTDAINQTRLFPFTGGSRFLQNGVFTRAEWGRLALALVLVAAALGLGLLIWLTQQAPAALPFLASCAGAGLFLLWGYSAPPLRLSARGLGEVAVTLAWSLVVAGSATLFAALLHAPLPPLTAWLTSLPFGLLVANILYINQFPDAPADARAGKRTWPVRLGRIALWGYPLIALLAALIHGMLVAADLLPRLTLVALLPLAASLAAMRSLFAFAHRAPQGRSWCDVSDFRPLRPAIVATLIAAHGYALLMVLALGIGRMGLKQLR